MMLAVTEFPVVLKQSVPPAGGTRRRREVDRFLRIGAQALSDRQERGWAPTTTTRSKQMLGFHVRGSRPPLEPNRCLRRKTPEQRVLVRRFFCRHDTHRNKPEDPMGRI